MPCNLFIFYFSVVRERVKRKCKTVKFLNSSPQPKTDNLFFVFSGVKTGNFSSKYDRHRKPFDPTMSWVSMERNSHTTEITLIVISVNNTVTHRKIISYIIVLLTEDSHLKKAFFLSMTPQQWVPKPTPMFQRRKRAGPASNRNPQIFKQI